MIHPAQAPIGPCATTRMCGHLGLEQSTRVVAGVPTPAGGKRALGQHFVPGDGGDALMQRAFTSPRCGAVRYRAMRARISMGGEVDLGQDSAPPETMRSDRSALAFLILIR